MKHLTEEEMVDGYYRGLSRQALHHLAGCRECSSIDQQLSLTLKTAHSMDIPERDTDYGSEVWSRVAAALPQAAVHGRHLSLSTRLAACFALGVLLCAGWLAFEQSRGGAAIVKPSPALDSTYRIPAAPREMNLPIVSQAAPPVVHAVQRKSKQPAVKDGPADVERVQDAQLLSISGSLGVDPKASLPQVLGLIRGDTSERTKEHALFVLAQSDSIEAHQALMQIAQESKSVDLQTKAIRMIGVLGNNDERKELTMLYRRSSNQELKHEILNGLMISGERTALQKVARSESDPGLRDSAVQNLTLTTPSFRVQNGSPEKQQILSSVFLAPDSQVVTLLEEQPDLGVRVATVRSMAALGVPGSVLTDLYRVDHDVQVRRAVLDALVLEQNSDSLLQLMRNETDEEKKREILLRVDAIHPVSLNK